jgi:amino-acid N-acetyltransferase
MIRIEELRSTDRQGVIALIERAGLPTADIQADSAARFLVAVDDGTIIGAIALEKYDADALLRSLVVSPERQKAGLGRQLVEAAEQFAAREHIQNLYLLTETASVFFGKRGYASHARDDAPQAIRSHPQFRFLCPSTAVLMSKELQVIIAPESPNLLDV